MVLTQLITWPTSRNTIDQRAPDRILLIISVLFCCSSIRFFQENEQKSGNVISTRQQACRASGRNLQINFGMNWSLAMTCLIADSRQRHSTLLTFVLT